MVCSVTLDMQVSAYVSPRGTSPLPHIIYRVVNIHTVCSTGILVMSRPLLSRTC